MWEQSSTRNAKPGVLIAITFDVKQHVGGVVGYFVFFEVCVVHMVTHYGVPPVEHARPPHDQLPVARPV